MSGKNFRIAVVLLQIGINTHLLTGQVLYNKAPENKGVDHLKQIYQIDQQILTKYTEKDTLSYRNIMLGTIDAVDISNPLRILVFSKSSNSLVFLDNTLSPIGDVILLDQLNAFDVAAVCNAQTNGFWLYNTHKRCLEHYDSQLKLTHQSAQIASEQAFKFSDMMLQSQNGNVFLYQPNKGILKFDRFGLYLKTYFLNNVTYFEPLEKGLLIVLGQQILFWAWQNADSEVILESESTITWASRIGNQVWYTEGNTLKSKLIKKAELE